MLGKYRCDFSVVGSLNHGEKDINWVSKEIRNCLGFALLHLWLVQKSRSYLSTNQIEKENQSWLDHTLFPTLQMAFFFFYYEFSLALRNIFPSSGWPLGFPWVWFYVTLSKCTLAWITDCYWRMNHWAISFVVDNDCP